MDRIQNSIQLRQDIDIPEVIRHTFLSEISGIQSVEHLPSTSTATRFQSCYQVAQDESFKEHSWSGSHTNQTIGVLRIEQHGLHLAIRHPIVVVENSQIEQHLHKVLGLRAWWIVGTSTSDVSPFSGFLFNENLIVELQQVHTSLYAEHLTEKRRLEHHLLSSISSDTLLQSLSESPTDVVFLLLSIGLQGAKVGGQYLEGIGSNEVGITIVIVFFFLLLMNGFIKQLACQVTQQGGRRISHLYQLVNQIEVRIVRIFLKATGDGCHIHQKVGP